MTKEMIPHVTAPRGTLRNLSAGQLRRFMALCREARQILRDAAGGQS